jgi:hypothetical protein
VRPVGFEVTLKSPALLASAPPASNQTETLRFIPGNSVRGILARRYLDRGHGAETEEFQRLFLSGEVCYGFAFAEGAEVLPLSARSCKYEPGFRGDGGHGAVDFLLPGGEADGRCPHPKCGRPVDYFQGFWLPGQRCEITVHTRLVTRTAIDPQRGTARAGQLYSQRVLSEGQSFAGTIEAPDDLAPRLVEMLEKGFPAVLGTGGSRGQGWAEVQGRDAAGAGLAPARARYERFLARAGKPVLAVTLLTDGLFRDDYLRESAMPLLRDLASLKIDPDDWNPRPVRAFMDLRTIFGFDGFPVRLPRLPRIAVAAGSAFLYEAVAGREPRIPDGEGAGWIGEVNGEGYGRAVLWHPFHLDPEGASE